MIRVFFSFLFVTSFLVGSENKDYRVYDESTPLHVKDFYRQNHQYQTLDFVLQKKEEYFSLKKQKLTIFEALALFDQIIDESDPDILLRVLRGKKNGKKRGKVAKAQRLKTSSFT